LYHSFHSDSNKSYLTHYGFQIFVESVVVLAKHNANAKPKGNKGKGRRRREGEGKYATATAKKKVYDY
jgi:hypothetical protein